MPWLVKGSMHLKLKFGVHMHKKVLKDNDASMTSLTGRVYWEFISYFLVRIDGAIQVRHRLYLDTAYFVETENLLLKVL